MRHDQNVIEREEPFGHMYTPPTCPQSAIRVEVGKPCPICSIVGVPVVHWRDFYFTFGRGHRLRSYWIRVTAETDERAREAFQSQFAEVFLAKPDQWSIQHEGNDFARANYQGGELMYLKVLPDTQGRGQRVR